MIGITEIMVFIHWTLLIVLAYLLIKYLINLNITRNYEGKSVLDIIKERYAKGEITKEEFEEIKKNMKLIDLLCYLVFVAGLLFSAYLVFHELISISEAILFDIVLLVLILIFRHLEKVKKIIQNNHESR